MAERLAGSIHMVPPKIDLVANVTARPAGQEIARPGYWRQHIRQPVRFAESIEANSVHGSDSPENAAIEIAYFFPQVQLCDYAWKK